MVVFVLVDSHLCNELDRDTHIEIFLPCVSQWFGLESQ